LKEHIINIIELTLLNKTKIFINANNITYYYYTGDNGKTIVGYVNGKLSSVLETTDDINKLIYDRTRRELGLC